MHSPDLAYQRYFEVENDCFGRPEFVDKGNAKLESPHKTDNWKTGLTRMGLIAGGMATGYLAATPIASKAFEAINSIKDPEDATKVGITFVGAAITEFASMIAGAGIVAYSWHRFLQRPERIISFSSVPSQHKLL